SPVLNATGVIIHTNLGRAPLSQAARDSLIAAAGYVDLELDLTDGKRSKRGAWAKAALLAKASNAEDALVVNNGAAALWLSTTALCVVTGSPQVLISRGELVEIGAGFRLPDLIVSTGVQLAEVGTTNRTNLDDYRKAITENTGAILKVHPSNYWIGGFNATGPTKQLASWAAEHNLPLILSGGSGLFDSDPLPPGEPTITAGLRDGGALVPATGHRLIGGCNATVPTKQLASLAAEHNLPLIVSVGSGLFDSDPLLPDEPTITAALRDGADIVLASGDKLLGGPQAGLLLGTKTVLAKLASHPLARAF